MVNRLLLTLSVLFFSSLLYAQIDELKKNSDKADKKINQKRGKSKNVNALKFVDPFIGTGGHGHTYPGATAPFGMMQLSPDTRHDGWDGCSGYHYSDSVIYGFSHTHLSGTGVPDYCDLLIVPQLGFPKVEPGYNDPNGYGHTFSHDDEIAEPGYYNVKFPQEQIDVELFATERAGMHVYRFNKTQGKRFILIDLDHRDEVLDASFNVHDRMTISGKRISKSWAEKQHFYFYIELDQPYQKVRTINKNGRNKLLLVFPKTIDEIKLKVGISGVDENGAKLNLKHEIPDWNQNKILKNTQDKWKSELNKIYFYSKDKDVMTNFYTGLYHSFLCPNLYMDVDGRYRGRDLEVHKLKDGEENYTVFSLWDTYRGTHPLFTITQQQRTNSFIQTFIRQFEQGGDLPVWELSANETECMIGYHSVSVVADAAVKGLRGFDFNKALNAMITTAGLNEFGKREFMLNGFISAGDEPESVSKTLEYAYDDYCITKMIESRGDNPHEFDEYQMLKKHFMNRSFNFINLFDPETKFMRARRSGLWFTPFDPAEVNFNYTEANSWQYSLYAPHAVGALTDLLGGRNELENWLDRLFTAPSDLSGRHQVDITGLIGQYAHGNEPSHHMAYLYNYTDAPEKTSVFIDSILYTMYSPTPDGLSGNEDCGQMSSWYVLSSLGFYQIAPGNPYYDFGRPLVDDAVLKLENGKSFSIKTVNNSKENKYIERITLNGRPYEKRYISHERIMQGGKLIFYMTSDPVKQKWEEAPTLRELPADFCPAPFFKNKDRIFTKRTKIDLGHVFPESTVIYYTSDGSDPSKSKSATIFKKPFYIDQTTTIKAIARSKEGKSAVIANTFTLKDENISIKLHSEYAPQYAASGDFTLIDGISGGSEYRTGDWQGYWDTDFEAEIVFAKPKDINKIEIGFLSDMKSWIFLPEKVSVQVSHDGKTFTEPIELELNEEIESDMYPHRKTVTINIDTSEKIRIIKVLVSPRPTCPEWHLGSGNPTWLFLDEISFE
jgi:predicted alpha-1,2-mannosidase